jgi:hypothetical protein
MFDQPVENRDVSIREFQHFAPQWRPRGAGLRERRKDRLQVLVSEPARGPEIAVADAILPVVFCAHEQSG